MSKLIGCVIAYNEEMLLPSCLDSVRPWVDELVVVEGRIAEMPGTTSCSTDRTRLIAQGCSDRVIWNSHPWKTEQEMRNQYLIGNDGDWYFVIDADEVLLTPLPRPEQLPDIPALQVRLTMMGTDAVTWPQRLFQHRGEMEYRELHDALYSDGVWVSDRRRSPKLSSVRLLHRQILRGRDRWADKRVKRKVCHDRETPIRVKLYGG